MVADVEAENDEGRAGASGHDGTPSTGKRVISITYPSKSEVNRKIFEEEMRLPEPRKTYVIFFTARSGSSWLTDLCGQTGVLGSPGESFNPSAVSQIALARNATSLEEYVAVLRRRKSQNGVFGFEITYPQMMKTFGSKQAFVRHFGDATAFWLTRRDIVKQAISVVKKRQTQIGHNRTGVEAPENSENDFYYDGPAFKRALKNLLSAEERTERYFSELGVTPVRLTYETLMATPPIEVANTLIRAIGEPELTTFDFKPVLQRTATAKNDDFAERFRSEYRLYMRSVDARRSAAGSAPAPSGENAGVVGRLLRVIGRARPARATR